MGTWNHGLLDNDAALDGLGDLHAGIVEDIEELGGTTPGPTTTARLAAAVGVLLQLSAYELGLDTESGGAIVQAVAAHRAQIAKLATEAREILERVIAGEGKQLAERPADVPAEHLVLLHADGASPFGKREPALFASKPAAAYVQAIAERCVDAIDDDFEDEANWCDLCREGVGMGALAALMVLDPCRVPAAKIERWRRRAKRGLVTLEAKPDGEIAFQRAYYANLDGVLEVILRRFH